MTITDRENAVQMQDMCGAEPHVKDHLRRHYEGHSQHRSKPVPYGDPHFPLPTWSANVDGILAPLTRALFGNTDYGLERKGKREKKSVVGSPSTLFVAEFTSFWPCLRHGI